MATISFYLDKRGITTNSFPLKLEVSHKGIRKYHKVNFKLTEEQWDKNKREITSKYPRSGRANKKLSDIKSCALQCLEDLEPHLPTLTSENVRDYIAKELEKEKAEQAKTKKPEVKI